MRITTESLTPAANATGVTPGTANATARAGNRDGDAPAAGSASETSLGASSVGLTSQAMAAPEVRSGLVERLRAQIASGSYEPAADDVADALVNDPQTGLGG